MIPNEGDVLKIDCYICTTARKSMMKIRSEGIISKHYKIGVLLKKEKLSDKEYNLKILEIIDNQSKEPKLFIQCYKYDKKLSKYFKKSSIETLEKEIIIKKVM